ncbi:MAG: hypothetical protein LN561_06525 [Rickettsia endosymbiont of Labidopullus appendiculatus]|nr:hypothetical protein [Rickettsia endosymbiont of Labidopullus appendiculatus]
MKIFSSSAGPTFLLATSALHHTVNSFPTESTTSILPSDAYSTSPEDHTLSSELHYGKDRFLGKLDDSLKTLNNSLTTWQDDNYSTASPKSHMLSSERYEEDSFSNTLDDDSFESGDSFSKLTEEYDKNYPPLTTSVETTAPEASSTVTSEVSATTPEVSSTDTPEEATLTTEESSTDTPEENTLTSEENTLTSEVSPTVSSTASSQEQNSNQGLWSYSIASLGLTIIGAATMLIKNKFCSNETQEESNKEMDTFDPSDFLTPLNNVTLELDNVALMVEPTEDTQA